MSGGPRAYTLPPEACIAETVKLKKYQYFMAVPSLSHDVGELRGSEAYLKARGPGVSLTN